MMRRVLDYRANKILYNFILSNKIQGKAIVPANVCQSVIDTLHLAGMELFFVDIAQETFCADRSSVFSCAREASLFLFVHTYGIEMDCPSWFFELRRINPGIAIVDDRCLCLPQLSPHEGMADLVLYSFCAKKQVDLGGGGIGFVSEKWNYERVPVIKNTVLFNLEWDLDEDVFFDTRQRVLHHKKHLNDIYANSLPVGIQMDAAFQQWRFNLLVSHKDIVIQELFKDGLFASGHYKSLLDGCVVASQLHNRVINLFNDFYYSEEQAIRTCKIINRVLEQYD